MNINEILKNDYDLLCKDYKKATKKIEKQGKEIERLNNIINEAIKKLSSAVNHFHTQRENNVITFTLKILKGSDKE